MFEKLISYVDNMINFDPGHCRGDVSTQMELKLENYKNGCEQIKLALTEAEVRMAEYDKRIETVINRFEKSSEELFKLRIQNEKS